MAAVAVLAFAGLVAWTFYPRPATRPPDAVRFTFDPPPGYTLTVYRSNGPQFAVSPDGRYVAFLADGGPNSLTRAIWVRALGTLAAQKLDKTEGANFPFWSPDSKNIAFFADDKLKRIAVTGGSPVNICDATDGDSGAWFQPEGSSDSSSQGLILFALGTASAIQRVPASGGVPTPVTKLAPGEAAHIHPQFLPDGKRFLYFVRGGAKPGIYVQPLGSEQRTFLLETPGRAVYAPPDLLLYMRDDTLLAQHWDWGALKPLGEPVSVADEVRFNAANGRNAFSTSSTGVLAYRRGASSEVVYTWHTRDGKSDGPGWADTAYYQHIELSPDNKRAVVERQATTGASNTGLDMVELAGGVVSRLTSDPGSPASSGLVPGFPPHCVCEDRKGWKGGGLPNAHRLRQRCAGVPGHRGPQCLDPRRLGGAGPQWRWHHRHSASRSRGKRHPTDYGETPHASGSQVLCGRDSRFSGRHEGCIYVPGKRIAGDLGGRIPLLHRPAQGRGGGSTVVAWGWQGTGLPDAERGGLHGG